MPDVLRVRLLLLALIAMLGMGATTWLGFRGVQLETRRLDSRAAHIRWARDCSDLVHYLQRERGASASHIASGATDIKPIRKLRVQTNDALEMLLANPLATPSRLGRMGLDDLPVKLMEARRQVDSRTAHWREVRNAYTTAINTLLGSIEFELMGAEEDAASRPDAIAELVLARESLGLLRATVASVQTPSSRLPTDIFFIAGELTLYRHHVEELAAVADPLVVQQVRAIMDGPGYRWVFDAVNSTLSMPDGAQDVVDVAQWWPRATGVIDELKLLEDALFVAQDQELERVAAQQKRYVMLMGLGSTGVLVALAVFVWRTIRRMMLDLRALSQTLDDIVEKENFTARLRVNGTEDELSHAFQMFNRLLAFTDRLLREKEYLASMDTLTGVMNRRSFLNYAQREMVRANRYGHKLSLIFLDIDHFKRVNDTYGHSTGDAVLKAFVGVINARTRETDLVARWGGEEFIVLAPETDLDNALAFAGSLREAVAATDFPEAGHVTSSLGIATWRPGESFEIFCSRADAALYQAKEQGRNRVCVESPVDHTCETEA